MITLNDEIIFSDFRNQIIENFINVPMAFSVVFQIIMVTTILSIYIILRKKFSYKNKVLDFAIIPLSFFIPICINLICIFGLKTCYKYYLDTHPNELNWNISIETVYYKEDIYTGAPGKSHKRHRYIYYLYFNQEQENNNSNTNKIKVKEDIFNKVKEGEKMYVVRNSENNIILVYSMKDYKYVKDEQLKDN